jgi:Adenylate and Guanylate cyclase catalytic domain
MFVVVLAKPHAACRLPFVQVETIGDCYVAVAGLPEPRRDHAVVMARFARDCMHQMSTLTKELEKSLGEHIVPPQLELYRDCLKASYNVDPILAQTLRNYVCGSGSTLDQ